MSAPPMHGRPIAHALPNGRTAVYCGAQYNHLPRAEALDLFQQLGDALDMPVHPQVAFMAWVASLHALPSHTQVMERFQVSRARAYHWIAAERTRRAACTSAR